MIANVLFIIITIILLTFSMVGMAFLTRFSFGAQQIGNIATVKMTKVQRNLTKVTVVLYWLSVLGILIKSFM